MTDDLLAKISGFLNSIPSLPVTVTKILEICDNPRTRPADINRLVSLDPVLAGRLLKLVNSAYFNGSRTVYSLPRAIVMLGINTVKNLVLSTAVLGILGTSKKTGGLEPEGFWRHSLGVAVAAKLIARQRGVELQMQEDYFTAGLLHDIGKVPMNHVLAGEYLVPVAAADRERVSLYRAEKNYCGISHLDAGNSLAGAWNLYGPVGDAITRHHDCHDYSGPYRDVLYTVVMANHFVVENEIGFSGDRHPEKLPSEVWRYFQPGGDFLPILKSSVHGEIEKASMFLEL